MSPVIHSIITKCLQIASDTLINVCAVVETVSPTKNYNRKSNGKPCERTDAHLADDANEKLFSMLWGDQAIELSQTANHVVFIQHARLSSYHGVIGLTSTPTAEFNFNIDHPETVDRALKSCTMNSFN